MQTSKKSTPKQSSPKLFLFVGLLVVLVAVIAWALYALNKPSPAPTNNTVKTTQSAQSPSVLSVNASLQQNGATQICSAGNAGPGSLSASSTNIAYEISKNHSDTIDVIKKVATESGYGDLAHTSNSAADFYEGKGKDTSTISFIVYSDRKFAECQPTPSSDPNQTAFILNVVQGK